MNKHQQHKSSHSLERAYNTTADDDFFRELDDKAHDIESIDKDRKRVQQEYEKLQQDYSSLLSENVNSSLRVSRLY
jgi:hypothetical protein